MIWLAVGMVLITLVSTLIYRAWRRQEEALIPVETVRRYKVAMFLDPMDVGEVLMQDWVPYVVDQLTMNKDDKPSVIIIKVSATNSDKAAAYVRRQLERMGVRPHWVEAR